MLSKLAMWNGREILNSELTFQCSGLLHRSAVTEIQRYLHLSRMQIAFCGALHSRQEFSTQVSEHSFRHASLQCGGDMMLAWPSLLATVGHAMH